MKKGLKALYNNIVRNYPSEKAQLTMIRNPWGYFVVRPISFRITPLFINLGFSANAVTTLELILNISGLAFIAFGAVSRYNFIIGAIIINIARILDGVDGDIARFQNNCTKFGEMYDIFVGMLITALLPVCLGIGLYFGAVSSISIWGIGLPGLLWLLIGVSDSCIYLFRRTLSLEYQIAVRHKTWMPKRKIVSIISAIPLSVKMPLLIVVLLLGILDFFMVGYMVYNLLALFMTIRLSLNRASEKMH